MVTAFSARFQLTKVSLMPRTFGMWAVSLLTTCQRTVFQNLEAGNPNLVTLADWQVSLCPLCFLLVLLDDTALYILSSCLHVSSTPWLTIRSNYFSYDASLCFLAEWRVLLYQNLRTATISNTMMCIWQ